jgi:hypothetical protein
MRNISAAGLTKLATQLGTEPINIIEIDWYTQSDGTAATQTYSDKDLTIGNTFIPGKIIEISQIDDVVDIVLTNSSTAQVNITLDDTDGSIKNLFNNYDLHLQPVRVYQWFAGLALSDRFLVFSGNINTPVSWSERDRTVKINAVSTLENQEVGFSPEQGQFPWLPSTMCGKSWPMIFGTVQDCPATQITRVAEAVSITPIGFTAGMDQYMLSPLYVNSTEDRNAHEELFEDGLKLSLLLMAELCWFGHEEDQGFQKPSGETLIKADQSGQVQQAAAEEDTGMGTESEALDTVTGLPNEEGWTVQSSTTTSAAVTSSSASVSAADALAAAVGGPPTAEGWAVESVSPAATNQMVEEAASLDAEGGGGASDGTSISGVPVGTPAGGCSKQPQSETLAQQVADLLTKMQQTAQKVAKKEFCTMLQRQANATFLSGGQLYYAGNIVGIPTTQPTNFQVAYGEDLTEAFSGGSIFGVNPIQTLGGEDFPQNVPITIAMGGVWFTGHFDGNSFYVSGALDFAGEQSFKRQLMTESPLLLTYCQQTSSAQQGKLIDLSQKIPCGSTCDGSNGQATQVAAVPGCKPPSNLCTPPCTMRRMACILPPPPPRPAPLIPPHYIWKEGGQRITMAEGQPISYVISIVPGEVLCVKAFKQYDGPSVLTVIPTDYYTISTVNYGPIQAVVLTMNQELKTYYYDDLENQGWSDEIYVSFQSSVGPNTVDIMKYLIATYTPLTWDDDSFDYCASKLTAFPSNFALLELKNIMDVLREIAFQCRCAIWIEDNIFYMKYLPEEPNAPDFTLAGVDVDDMTTWGNDPNYNALPAPYVDTTGLVTTSITPAGQLVTLDYPPGTEFPINTPQNQVVDVITISDIDADKGVEIGYTPTEDVCTKMKVTWRLDLAPDNPYPSDREKHEQVLILRHNMAMYGYKEKTFNWYIYNQPDIILKCATFWLIRQSITWKTLKFSAYLNKLNIQTLDAVIFDDGGRNYVSNGPITCVVKKAQYNSADNMIDFELEVPVKAGELNYYPFYWPSKLPSSVTWPPADEIASGAAGGGGIGVWATGNLPVGVMLTSSGALAGPLSGGSAGELSGNTIFVGGPNVVYGSNIDWGDPTPTDQGFTAQTTVDATTLAAPIANPDSGTKPYGVIPQVYTIPEPPPIPEPPDETETVIDLYSTRITNWTMPHLSGRLGDFFSITPNGGLRLELAVAQIVDNRTSNGPLGTALATTGRDATLSDLITVQPTPSGVTNQSTMIAVLDATSPGIYGITDDSQGAVEIDFKYDDNGEKIGIATAFLNTTDGASGP